MLMKQLLLLYTGTSDYTLFTTNLVLSTGVLSSNVRIQLAFDSVAQEGNETLTLSINILAPNLQSLGAEIISMIEVTIVDATGRPND